MIWLTKIPASVWNDWLKFRRLKFRPQFDLTDYIYGNNLIWQTKNPFTIWADWHSGHSFSWLTKNPATVWTDWLKIWPQFELSKIILCRSVCVYAPLASSPSYTVFKLLFEWLYKRGCKVSLIVEGISQKWCKFNSSCALLEFAIWTLLSNHGGEVGWSLRGTCVYKGNQRRIQYWAIN